MKGYRNISSYRNTVKKNIRKKIKNTGTGVFPGIDRISVTDLIPPGCKPFPVQKLTEDLVTKNPDFQLLLIEAIMGEGKSQAASYAAVSAVISSGMQGIYFALPTNATAESMIGRMAEMLGMIKLKNRVNFATGKAWASEFASGSDEAIALYKTVGTKILSNFSVGTVDQALFSVCKSRFNDIALSGVSNIVLIIDELHSYDAYMMHEIRILLEWMKEFRCPVILLSATLTDSVKKDIFSIYDIDEPLRKEYPLVSMVSDGRLIQETCEVSESKKYRVNLEFHSYLGNCPEIMRLAQDRLQNGGNLLIVTNTVDRAVKLYLFLKECMRDTEIMLFHALTSEGYKKRKTKTIIDKYGKDGKMKGHRPEKSIVIATSIISESIDIDFDFLIMEIKPIDIVFQTLGREARHDDIMTVRVNSWYYQNLIILLPPEGISEKSCNPYHRDVLLSTYNVLKDRTELVIPDDIRPLINRVYDEAGDEWLKEEASNRAKSSIKTIDEPGKYSFSHDLNSEETRKPGTRLEKYATRSLLLLDDDSKEIDVSDISRLMEWNLVGNVPEYKIPEEILMNPGRYQSENLKFLKDAIVLTKSEAEKHGIYIDEEIGLVI